jgi:hypothetical protein
MTTAPRPAEAMATAAKKSVWSLVPPEEQIDAFVRLADALEEAGCDNQEIVAYCRAPGPHVRGWSVVDLAPGKE